MDMLSTSSKRHKQSLHANKVILGPMVRVGTLPMRLLALNYGAELVYTEEIIDFKLIKSRRIVNELLDTIDFIDESGVVVFRTCNLETDKVVLQIGTNNADRAVEAAKKVVNDVAAIDINMGCPKSFSLKGGMGAALMSKPQLIQQIIRSLKANISKPISCKIRVFEDLHSTLELFKLIEEAGADAIAIHGRTKEERPRHENRNDYIRAASNLLNIPVIANGDSANIKCHQDINEFRTKTKASSVMISRAAMKNCSIFSNQMVDLDQIIREYLMLAIQYDNQAINTKYCIQQMLGSLQEIGKGKLLMGAYDLKTMSHIYQLQDYYDQLIIKRQTNKTKTVEWNEETNSEHFELPVIFEKTVFDQKTLPKTILNQWISKNQLAPVQYKTEQIEKQFHSTAHFMGKSYSTPYLEKSKKLAEQAAALVILLKHGLCDHFNVIHTCLVDEKNGSIGAIEHRHNDRTYLIKVNQ